jgi:hypothetical protein
MKKLRQLLRRQDGLTLVMAVGILGVLTLTGTTLVYYSGSNSRSAEYSNRSASAYNLAEAGINEMMAVLSKPTNNALNKYLLGWNDDGTVTKTVHEYDSGTVEWSGTLTQSFNGSSTWNLTATGSLPSPTNPASAVTRTLTAKVPVVPTYTQPLNNPSWNFIYSRGTGATCDMTISQSVEVRSPLYVAGNLCLTQSAAVTAGPLVVQGSLSLDQQNRVGDDPALGSGHVTAPINQLGVRNGCKWKTNATHNPCVNGLGSTGTKDNVWATTITNNPGTSSAPTVDWDAWYLNSNPGPYYGCLSSSGIPPSFDNDQGSLETPSATHRNNSLTTVQNLTPASSYTCKSSGGELSWNAATRVLTANGTIFIDGSAKVENGAVNTYRGSATIYVSGTLLIKSAKLCQATTGSGNATTCTTSGWDPAQRMLVFVVNGNGSGGSPQSQVAGGDSVQLVSAYAQGAIYATNAIDLDTTSQFDGPLDGQTVKLGQSTSSSFPGLSFVPAGMPGNPEVYAEPQAPQLYSG